MARLPGTFNAAENEKLGDFTPIPAGAYLAQIKASAIKETKNGSGSFLQLTYEILEGDYLGRNLFVRLNIQNPNVQTVEIAQKTLATICECAGVSVLEDSEQLHGKPMYINVIVKPADAQYPAQNDIKGYSPADGAPPLMAPTSTTPIAKPMGAAPAKATPPWKRA